MTPERFPENKELCLILVTSNISQTAVAKAAEEDVDSFIIKPYTIQSIQENLMSTVLQKVSPSEYAIKIEESKTLLFEGKYEESVSILKSALGLHPRPALALFYIGQAEYLKERMDKAADSYSEGLNYNNIHYKCLVGLYSLFIRENKPQEAYSIVKKIAKFFPANPDRLSQIVRLAIQTGNFQDMQTYYDIFISLEERDATLVNYIGAGMYIAGKHHLMNNSFDIAFKYFENIAVSCSEHTKFIRAIISVLVQHGKAEEAEKFLSRFSPEALAHEDYLVSDFLVSSSSLNDNGQIIKMGLDIYNKKIKDYLCLKTMIAAMKREGYKAEKISPYEVEIARLAA
jgi:tetratricopeptide (TPR) repeat protein